MSHYTQRQNTSPATRTLAQAGAENSMQRFKVPENLVRISVGLEGAEDLWNDLRRSGRRISNLRWETPGSTSLIWHTMILSGNWVFVRNT